jgi:endonuclease/exonuclease/phosphatase family metal-dependent hydrolase
MVSKASVFVLLLAVCFLLASCGPANNYLDALEPQFVGSFADQPSNFSGTIKVVSYNISFAENIDRAIYELGESDELKDADIILLQEMDETGAQAIAQALSYNYVYYPASIHYHSDKNFGNAILAKWPIHAPKKIILPHKSPRNQEIRIAVKAIVSIDGVEIPTYSVHTETFWLGRQKRDAQVEALIESIDTSHQYIIVGGDFNTLTPRSTKELEQRFGEIGMDRATRDAENTARYAPLEFTLDHIFTKGMTVIEAGNLETAEASDHLPIWTKLTPRVAPQP